MVNDQYVYMSFPNFECIQYYFPDQEILAVSLPIASLVAVVTSSSLSKLIIITSYHSL